MTTENQAIDVTTESAEVENQENQELENQEVENQENETENAENAENAENEAENVENEEEPIDETEEIEYNNKKYRVNKELKDAFLRHKDYTQKTQAAAEERRQLEQERKAVEAMREIEQEYIDVQAERKALEIRLKDYKEIDWKEFARTDPVGFQEHWLDYNQLMNQQNEVKQREETVTRNKQSIAQKEYAKRLDQANKILQRDIPNWSPQYAVELSKHAISQLGYTPEEIDAIEDPRIVKLIHKDYVTSKKKVTAPAVKPVTALKGVSTTPVVKNPENMSDSEWLASRKRK